MEILGVGPLEILFIFMIALIVLGPKDMKKAGLTMGRFMRKIITSQGWREFQQGWRNLRYLPNRLMREAGMEEEVKSLNESLKELKDLKPSFDFKDVDQAIKETENDISAWLKPPVIDSPPPPSLEDASIGGAIPKAPQTVDSPQTFDAPQTVEAPLTVDAPQTAQEPDPSQADQI